MDSIYYIYKITAPNGKLYFGSTNNFNQRYWDHTSCIFNDKSSKKNYLLYKNLKESVKTISDFKMDIVENIITNDNEIVLQRELDFILTFKTWKVENGFNQLFPPVVDKSKIKWILNQRKCSQQADYYQRNKEFVKSQVKKYRDNNIETIREKDKKRLAENKDKYNQNRKDKYKTKTFESIQCECGGKYSTRANSKNRHIATDKHQKSIQKN